MEIWLINLGQVYPHARHAFYLLVDKRVYIVLYGHRDPLVVLRRV